MAIKGHAQNSWKALAIMPMEWGCDSVTSNIFVSMQSVMGSAQIFNPNVGIVPLTANTSFHLDTQRNEATYLSSIDFDGDGKQQGHLNNNYKKHQRNNKEIHYSYCQMYFETGTPE